MDDIRNPADHGDLDLAELHLREIAKFPCVVEAAGETPSDEGCGCPGCRARTYFAQIDANERARFIQRDWWRRTGGKTFDD